MGSQGTAKVTGSRFGSSWTMSPKDWVSRIRKHNSKQRWS